MNIIRIAIVVFSLILLFVGCFDYAKRKLKKSTKSFIKKSPNSIAHLPLDKIQRLAADWNKRNFGGHYGSGYRNLLGVAEEVGELCHAQLKGEQKIRHSPEEINTMKKDAVGDILIFLCNYCDSQNISMGECIDIAWNEIKDRDWGKANEKE